MLHQFHTRTTSFHTTYLAGYQIYLFSVHLHHFFMISSVIQTRDLSSSDYIHGCIVVSNLSVNNRARPYRYIFFLKIYSQPLQCTPSSLFFFSLYSFPFIKTMSQNHEPLVVFLLFCPMGLLISF